MITVLQQVARRESVSLPAPFAARIALQSGRTLRMALLALEAAHATQ